MSYTRTYTHTVRLHKNVHYSASEHGGTIPVTMEETVYINVTVDTNPFDHGIEAFRGQIRELSQNITVSSDGQIQQKQLAAKKISSTAVNGFRNLISAEIDQQLIEIRNRVRSNMALMGKEKQEAINQRMAFYESYNMIKKRYYDLFQKLDKELNDRIKEIDKYAFNLIDDHYREHLAHKFMTLPGQLMGFNQENQRALETVAAVTAQNSARELVRNVSAYIGNQNEHKRRTFSILLDRQIKKIVDYCVPMIVFEKDRLESDEYQTRDMGIITPESSLIPEIDAPQPDALKWNDQAKKNRTEKDKIEVYFKRKMERRTQDDVREKRIAETMAILWKEAEFQTLKSIKQ